MRIEEAYMEADALERHHCLHVEMFFNGVGMLQELGVQPPAFSMRATAWLILARHDDEGLTIYGLASLTDTVEDALIIACWNAMAQQGMRGLNAGMSCLDSEVDYEGADWRCPLHEVAAQLTA